MFNHFFVETPGWSPIHVFWLEIIIATPATVVLVMLKTRRHLLDTSSTTRHSEQNRTARRHNAAWRTVTMLPLDFQRADNGSQTLFALLLAIVCSIKRTPSRPSYTFG
jgi:hypothetical protein